MGVGRADTSRGGSDDVYCAVLGRCSACHRWLAVVDAPPSPNPARVVRNQAPQPYRCVAIRPGQEACPTVRNLAGRRFLAQAAPLLPLDDCTAAGCGCRYDHFADRREHERRRSHALMRGLTPQAGNTDHRSGRDRRKPAGFAPDASQ